MKKDHEDPSQGIESGLRERLTRVLEHLRGATSSRQKTLCHEHGTAANDGPPGWQREPQSEEIEIRLQAYRWAQAVLVTYPSITIGEAITKITENSAVLVSQTAESIERCVAGLIPKEYQNAVLGRDRLIATWPWPFEAFHGGAFLHLLLALHPPRVFDEPLCTRWPLAHTTSATVAAWAEQWLRQQTPPTVTEQLLLQMKTTVRNRPLLFPVRPGLRVQKLTTPALALLYSLEQEVRENQKRPFIALDTNKEATKLMEAWRDTPKSKQPSAEWAWMNSERFLLILPDEDKKRHIQLSLNLDTEGLSERMAQVIREWRGWQGLRHWATFQSLLTANGRLGWVRWTVDDHLRAQNLSPERCRRRSVRRAAAEMVSLFTELQLAVYDRKGKLREKRPLILTGSTFERLVDSEWEIEGLQLQINPLLYRGVRNPDNQQVGTNWWPAPKTLPHLDPDKFGPALALGLILPSRWRMEWSRSGKTYIDLRGDSLLRAAGLPFTQRKPSDDWRSLQRNLDELQRREGLERWEWLGEPELSTICRLHAPNWALDRIAYGVPPKESLPPPTALTGAELRAWREEHGLSQAKTADLLHVGVRTIERAEANPHKPLSKRLRSALTGIASDQRR